MKRLSLLLLILLSFPARAAGVGAYLGRTDADSLGDGTVYGAQLDFDFFPCVSLLVRGGRASDFDEFPFGGGPDALVADDVEIVPVEAGLLFRPPPLFGLVGVYGGGGAGWYCIPGFDVKFGGNAVGETDDVTDLVGWWASAGVEIGIPSFRVFGEAKYQSAEKKGFDVEFRDDRDKTGVRAGMDLSGVTLLAGVRIAW